MKKIIIVCMILTAIMTPAFSQVAVVYDPSNWLTAIDTLYAQYDMVMNTIKQIESQYEQYQHLVQEAQSWSFDTIQWDGDWDFRNEIKNVTSSVNQQVSTIRDIESIFTTQQYTLGSMSFSVTDLVGLGDTDKDIFDLIEHAGETAKNTFATVVDTMVNDLSEEQQMAIWRKYGLSPRNYIYLQKKKELVSDVAQSIIASATDEAVQLRTEANLQGANNIMSTALNGGEKTEKELQQQTILMLNELIKNINALGISMDRVGSLEALRTSLEDEKDYQEAERQAAIIDSTVKKSNQDDFF